MAMVALPFAVGIFLVERVDIPLWVLAVSTLLMLLLTLLLRGWQQWLSATIMLAMAGATLHALSFDMTPHYNTPFDMELRVERRTMDRGSYSSTEVRINSCSFAPLEGRRLMAWGLPQERFSEGDMVKIRGAIRPFSQERRSYAEQMFHRNFIGSISLNKAKIYGVKSSEKISLHERVIRRLDALLKPSEERSIIMAMVVGFHDEIAPSLRKLYSASGLSHLLAVSGLHLYIAFLLINLLLYPLPSLPYGNILRSVLAILLIWLYVVMCGASPSSIRAAVMFSVFQLSISTTREYVSLNSLAATAFVMLAFDTHLLFNISFQLSVAAVSAILCWALPLYKTLRRGSRPLNHILLALLISLASTLATAPLVSHYFNIISFVGIFNNIIIVAFVHLILLSSLLALIPPFGPLIAVAEWVTTLQNRFVEWSAKLEGGHIYFSLSEEALWVIYATFTVITLIFCAKNEKKEAQIEDN